MKKTFKVFFFIIATIQFSYSQNSRLRDFGIEIGIFSPGDNNAIIDVAGVKVGHTTLIIGDSVRTGVTAILPHGGNIFQEKVPAAIYVGNGFGKLAGSTQVEELGNIETPIILTNTLSVPVGVNGLITYTLGLPGNENVRSVNAVVGETNDGRLNDIRGRHVKEHHILEAINSANETNVEEGNVGAGTGTICFGYKGGIGTSSRVLPESLGGYTVGVLVQSNFGGVLQIQGMEVGKKMGNYPFKNDINDSGDGSCMIVVATDAPLDTRNLKRLAKRAFLGLGKTGAIASNGSGDYIIAFSTAKDNRILYHPNSIFYTPNLVFNNQMTPLFASVIEATEEAILNSLFAAKSMSGNNNSKVSAIPIKKVLKYFKME